MKTKSNDKANDPYVLSIEEALGLLATFTERKKLRVHTIVGMGGIVMGCDMDLSAIKKLFEEAVIEGDRTKDDLIRLGGENVTAIGHGVGVYQVKKDAGWLFIETDSKKLAAIHKQRGIDYFKKKR